MAKTLKLKNFSWFPHGFHKNLSNIWVGKTPKTGFSKPENREKPGKP